MSRIANLTWLLVLPACFHPSVAAARPKGVIEGRARMAESGAVIGGFSVSIRELRAVAWVSESGTFRFTKVRSGTYHLRVDPVPAEGPGQEVTVRPGETTQVTIKVDRVGMPDSVARAESVGVDAPVPSALLPCTIRPMKDRFHVGDKPAFAVSIRNQSGREVVLVPSLEGSSGSRYPHAVVGVDGPVNGARFNWGMSFCGNLNGIGPQDFVVVPAGGEFDPLHGEWETGIGEFVKPGAYTARFIYSTDEGDVRNWSGDFRPKRLPVEMSRLFRRVPRITDTCSVQFVVDP